MSSKTQVLENKIADFVLWCSETERELPFNQVSTEPVSENRKRTGAKEGLYPPGYFGGQYPALWKIPAAADSAYYQSVSK